LSQLILPPSLCFGVGEAEEEGTVVEVGLAGKLWRKQKPKQNKNENQVKPRTVKREEVEV